MNLRQAAEMALETLQRVAVLVPRDDLQVGDAITALRAALAEADEPVQGPVAWRYRPMIGLPWSFSDDGYYISCKRDNGYIVEALYPHPPRREPLTEEQIRDLWSWASTHEAEKTATTQQHAFARAIEKFHGIGGDE